MKTFIVFVGILIINISFIIYQGDMNRYVQAQNFLKATAEECASGAALYYDENLFSEGKMVFKYSEGIKFIENFLNETENKMPFENCSKIMYSIVFEDDLQGYKEDSNPSVEVILKVETEDFFRLPFLNINNVERMAKYELPKA
ncbi:hypothetical protein [Anaerovorax odorimutans]|uniref:hypothetical protein n=1 Tax=Anaerovorax odorimutans TaxID=109327 RepID=UPI00042107C2|nr:hypothetical protein [Anaerovorax odorimutans]